MALTLAQADGNRGAIVRYRHPATREDIEVGRIDSVTDRWVLVRYLGGSEPVPTHPDNLTLIGEE